MIQTIIGKKTDQIQTFLENGQRIPVTEIAVAENVVLQVKTAEKDSYTAVQLGAGVKKKPNRAAAGHAKKAGRETTPVNVKEVRITDAAEAPAVGDTVALDAVLKPGDIVQVTGTSKGKGFAGTVKRHGFRGGPKTHGQSDRHRAPGSIGQGTTPGRVYKGKRMAGRMGTDTVTIKNLTVVDVDAAAGRLLVSGLVPGYKNSWVSVTKIGENKKFVPLLAAKDDAPVVTPDEAVVTPEETVADSGETVETPAETGKEESSKAASADSSGEPKEVESDADAGELETPTGDEKEEIAQAAEANAEAEKASEAEAAATAEEGAAAQGAIDVGTQEEKKAAVVDDSGEPKEEVKENAS